MKCFGFGECSSGLAKGALSDYRAMKINRTKGGISNVVLNFE